MSDQDIVVDQEAAPRSLPGEVLRQAREQQGLTLGEVSGVLKFSMRQITALENDDYEQLQGKTFLRGFIRAYARLLKLPPDPLLKMLGEASEPSPLQIAVPANMGETNPVSFYRRHAKKLAVSGLLLFLVSIVWFLGLVPTDWYQAPPAAVAVPAEPASVPLKPSNDAALVVAPAPSMTAQDVTAAQPAAAPSALVFDFFDRSWLEVKDASGAVLLTGEFLAGQTQTVTGKPPYKIWVGKVSAVKLNYGGLAVDLQPYSREDVARFTLD